MAFAPENPLEEIMARAASDPAIRPQFYGMLMQSPLFALGRVKDHTAIDEVLPVLDSHFFELAQISGGGPAYHPIFTAMSRVRAFTTEPQEYFMVTGRTLFENTRGAAFLLNCRSEVGKELLPDEIDYVLKALEPRASGRPDIALSLPDPYPKKLTGALSMFFVHRSQVEAAHLVQAAISGKKKPHLLIGLVGHGDLRRIQAEIGEVAAAIHTRNIVDVILLDAAAPRDALQTKLLSVPPFYARPLTLQ